MHPVWHLAWEKSNLSTLDPTPPLLVRVDHTGLCAYEIYSFDRQMADNIVF